MPWINNRTMSPMRFVEPLRRPLPRESASNGCFETMRAYGGQIFRLEAHLDRLYASAKFLGARAPSDRTALGRQLINALERSRLREAVVRVALFPRPFGSPSGSSLGLAQGVAHGDHATRRGQAQQATRATEAFPSIVVQRAIRPPASAYRRGIRIAVVPARKFSVGSIDPQAKYSARLGSVLAVADAQLRGVDEALFMDAMGSVTESTASNVGIISDGVILTPPCWLGLLEGITRDVLFELAQRLAISIEEVPLTRHDLYNAEEAFLTSTLKEVLAVTWIDGRQIGAGRPGPVTLQLHRAFHELVREELSGRSHKITRHM